VKKLRKLLSSQERRRTSEEGVFGNAECEEDVRILALVGEKKSSGGKEEGLL